jgi:beta-lactamase class A
MTRNPLDFQRFSRGGARLPRRACDSDRMAGDAESAIRATFAAAGATGTLHARDLETGAGLGVDADRPRISLRDLALSMMTVSDNAATDLVLARIGVGAVTSVLRELGLAATHVRQDMMGGARQVAAELGLGDVRDLDRQLARVDPTRLRALRWLDPAHANATTASDTSALLAAIWTDRAGPPAACGFVRTAMSQQVNDARLASGFGPHWQVAGKTGTLPGIRNEAGVVQARDGRRIAVAVFTRAEEPADRNPAIDRAIGRAAAIAAEALRSR